MPPPTHPNDILRRTSNFRSDHKPFWLKGLGDTFSLTVSPYEFAGTLEDSSSANSVHRVSAHCTFYTEPAGQTALFHAGGAGSLLRLFEATHPKGTNRPVLMSGLPSGAAMTLLVAHPSGIPVYTVKMATPRTYVHSETTGAAGSFSKGVKPSDRGVPPRQDNLLELLNQWSKEDIAADDPEFENDFDELKSRRLKFNTRD